MNHAGVVHQPATAALEISHRRFGKHQGHSAQSDFVFDIDRPARISRRIGGLRPLDIHRAGVIRRPCFDSASAESRQQ